MKIGIIGAGEVGSSLGKALSRVGHQVMFSSREPNSPKMQELVQEMGGGASVGTVEDALAYGDVLAVALRWDAVNEVTNLTGWDNKVVIDMTNRFTAGSIQTAAEDLALMTKARVVKAFNTIGAEHYQDPNFDGQSATMFIAGDDTDAKAVVRELAESIGFSVEDVGELAASRYLESLAQFWVYLARSGYGRNIAFKLLKK